MKSATLALIVFGLGCAAAPPESPLVEIPDILADPRSHHGQVVRIRGAAVVRFEGSFICPEPELIDSESAKGCVWLTPAEVRGTAYRLQPLHQRIVEVVGRFDATSFGHMGAFGGTIAVQSAKVIGSHGMGDIPPPPPPPPGSSANNSSKPNPLRGSA